MKSLLNKIGLALLAVALLLGTSCEKLFVRRPLYELANTHYVRVYVDTSTLNVTTGYYDLEGEREYPVFERPQVLRLMLADVNTGVSRSERFLQHIGKDDDGLYYDGYIIADPDDYCLMAYNFGTEATVMRNPYLYNGIEAYTNHISEAMLTKLPSYLRRQQQKVLTTADSESSNADETKSTDTEPIVYAPDHLYVANADYVHIPLTNHIDTIYVNKSENPRAKNIVESWYIQIRVRGAKNISSIVGLISGMGGSETLVSGELKDPSTIYLEMLTTDENEEGVATLYTTFTTFGRLDGSENEFTLDFDIITVDGRGHSVKIGDISQEFLKPNALQHRWILLDKVIEVPDPAPGSPGEAGGFNPYISDWETVEGDILI